MQAPKTPSFFKTTNAKTFSFKPRYYDANKERIELLKKGHKSNLKFKRNHLGNTKQKGRNSRVVFLIIALSLLAYKLIIN